MNRPRKPLAEVERRLVVSGDIQLAVYCRGDPDRPAVVLVHGYPDNASVWNAVAGRLADDFFVVTYDVRGAGNSQAPAGTQDYRLQSLAQDLKAVTDAVCPGRPFHLVGHDWGSVQSWEPVTDANFQSRIASFTTISGPCLDHMGYWFRDRLGRPTPGNLWRALRQLLCSWYVLFFHLPWLAPLAWRALRPWWPRLLARAEGVPAADDLRLRDALNGLRLYRANVAARLWSPRPRHTDVPVQLILPTRERFMIPELFEDLERWAPQLRRREIAAGHWALLSQPTEIAGFIRDFAALHDTRTKLS